jgi:neutral ceramidase
MLRVGNFVMLVMPGELTTMAGRRIRSADLFYNYLMLLTIMMSSFLSVREAIRTKIISSGIVGEDAYVVVAGPANTYGVMSFITARFRLTDLRLALRDHAGGIWCTEI